MQALVDRLFQQLRIIDDVLDFQSHVADDHRKSEILHRARPRNRLAPFPLRVASALKDPFEYPSGDFGIFLTPSGLGELRECHACESVREYVVRLHERLSLTGQREVEVVVAVVAVFLEELGALDGGVQPFLLFSEFVAKHREQPDLTPLKPDELVCVVDTSVSVKAGEVATIFLVDGIVQPERKDTVQKLCLVLVR